MRYEALNILNPNLLPDYISQADAGMQDAFDALTDAEISTADFSFYTSVSSVFSSKIEGEDIELDSYIRHKTMGVTFLPDYTKKTDDLYNAYIFAQNHSPDKENLTEAHRLLSKHLLTAQQQGVFRRQNMYVTTPDGRIEYVAALPHEVAVEMEKLYTDLALLLAAEMNMQEVFYFAAMLHLVFVKIHPYSDGNGRSARLLEKWFLAQKLGKKAWFLQSEKHYYQQHQTYYKNIRLLGLEYADLDYTQALPFLKMLSGSLVG